MTTPASHRAPEHSRAASLVPSVVPWVIAAGCALLAVGLGFWIRSLQAANESLRTQHELAEVAHQLTRSQLAERTLVAEGMITELGRDLQRTENLARLHIATLAPLPRNLTETRAAVVWDPERQAGLLVVEQLPVVSHEQDYQLWVIDSQSPDSVAAGVFKPDSTGKATLVFQVEKPVRSAAGFAVTLEKARGAARPEGPMVLRGER